MRATRLTVGVRLEVRKLKLERRETGHVQLRLEALGANTDRNHYPLR